MECFSGSETTVGSNNLTTEGAAESATDEAPESVLVGSSDLAIDCDANVARERSNNFDIEGCLNFATDED